MAISTPILSDLTVQTEAAYKTNIDSGFDVSNRAAWAFAPFADVDHKFTASEVDTAGDKITVTGHLLINDDIIRFTTDGTLPGGLAAATDHFVINRTANDFQVSLTQAGPAVDITSGGTGNHTALRSADLTAHLNAGHVANFAALPTEVAIQKTAALVAPSANPRKDIVHIDQTTGAVGVATGTEAASPVDPAVPAGKIAVARVNWIVSQTQIVNADLDDLRSFLKLGRSTAERLSLFRLL